MLAFRGLRRLAIVAILTVAVVFVLVACGDDDDASEPTAAPAAPAAPATEEPAAPAPTLRIGVILPETGALGAYGVPMIGSVRLAEEDILAAGGAIEVIYGDSGTDPDVATETTNRLLGEGAHVIVGAASSG
ncbi:MAG: ABC transporter substrate-binding protein, partial [Chloroflexi bacterium]|nr:ABC transporter substrate-binding protein [Chloroflexota bacterium]